jgi:hypothetical protein
MALFLLSANLGWIQGQFNFTEDSLRYLMIRDNHHKSGQQFYYSMILKKVVSNEGIQMSRYS